MYSVHSTITGREGGPKGKNRKAAGGIHRNFLLPECQERGAQSIILFLQGGRVVPPAELAGFNYIRCCWLGGWLAGVAMIQAHVQLESSVVVVVWNGWGTFAPQSNRKRAAAAPAPARSEVEFVWVWVAFIALASKFQPREGVDDGY